MMKKGSIAISIFPNSSMLMGWCRGRRQLRRRRGSTVRLGNKRRGFNMGLRPVIRLGMMMVAPLRLLKRMIMEIRPKGNLIEAYYMYLPFLRPQLFPLC
ncbi:hypothetical protein ERO13_D07G095100v2 [Gossypium hirsutum]|uniref:Uncharacterized protein n=2 Tax=Gossypium TaxID=3633 RepID=A0A5J5QQN3_GOSBA|nr:hypothetical protein ES319_D07G101200v1 [Gossypium barbadense]KAG4137813.1 hypothetical protein ERO13_D07G095100v2 [Gossypium hirsutum]